MGVPKAPVFLGWMYTTGPQASFPVWIVMPDGPDGRWIVSDAPPVFLSPEVQRLLKLLEAAGHGKED